MMGSFLRPPAKVEIRKGYKRLDSRFHGNDQRCQRSMMQMFSMVEKRLDNPEGLMLATSRFILKGGMRGGEILFRNKILSKRLL
jgi:hypothetical protein